MKLGVPTFRSSPNFTSSRVRAGLLFTSSRKLRVYGISDLTINYTSRESLYILIRAATCVKTLVGCSAFTFVAALGGAFFCFSQIRQPHTRDQ